MSGWFLIWGSFPNKSFGIIGSGSRSPTFSCMAESFIGFSTCSFSGCLARNWNVDGEPLEFVKYFFITGLGRGGLRSGSRSPHSTDSDHWRFRIGLRSHRRFRGTVPGFDYVSLFRRSDESLASGHSFCFYRTLRRICRRRSWDLTLRSLRRHAHGISLSAIFWRCRDRNQKLVPKLMPEPRAKISGRAS